MNWIKFSIIGLLLSSCCCGKFYNPRGTSIPKEIKTFSVDFFNNEAQLVNPQLSLLFTEKVKTKFQTQSTLALITSNGDYRFSGAIIDYSIKPATIDNNSGVAQNQFTISVRVIFECPSFPEKNFTKDFNFFRTFDASKDFSSVENSLSDEITDNIVQQIFAATAFDW